MPTSETPGRIMPWPMTPKGSQEKNMLAAAEVRKVSEFRFLLACCPWYHLAQNHRLSLRALS